MPKPPRWVRSAQKNGRNHVGKKAGSAIEPDGVDEWPEPTDPGTNGTEEDEDLVWIVDDDGEEGEEDEEDGEDELRSQEGRLDAVGPELAQFVNLFEQDTTRRKLFKTGFTVHLNRSARDEFDRRSKELMRVAESNGRKITAWVSVDTEDEMEKAIGAVLYGAARKRTTLYTPANITKAISALSI